MSQPFLFVAPGASQRKKIFVLTAIHL